MGSFRFWSVLCLLLFSVAEPLFAATASNDRPPNVVLIYADDMGYADPGCYGSRFPTPNLDRMAREGLRFTDFHVPQAVCSASRAALLTGCYPNRISLYGALGPRSKVGLNTNEVTIPRLLKKCGYATAIYGKWHLGDNPAFLPKQHGFDDYFGLPFSNDMWPFHPTNGKDYPPLPLIEGDRVVQLMPDQTQLTTWYTQHAVDFIQKHKDAPFFLYLAHSMPHVPLFVSDRFKGKSGLGLYGDVMAEIDWSVGEVLQTLKANNLEARTLVIFASDNGPWLLYGDHAGSAGPFREGKATVFEGGVRVPCIMRWPGQIPPGRVCDELATTMDILPTLAHLAGAELPQEHVIDGKDIWPLLAGIPGARSPHEAFFYYWDRQLQAVRSGRWKLHLAHSYPQPSPAGGSGKPGTYATRQIGLELFDLQTDPGETQNVAADHPDIVARLQELAGRCREDLGDSLVKREGRNVRPPGRLAE